MSAAQPNTVRTKRGGSIRTHKLSRHTTTHIDILQTLLPVQIEVTELESDRLVTVLPVDPPLAGQRRHFVRCPSFARSVFLLESIVAWFLLVES